MKKSVKILLGVIAAVLVAAIICLSVFLIQPYVERGKKREAFAIEKVGALNENGDYIHFINTNNSDAILLESNGHFAMIDAGEDTDNPRGLPGLELGGYEQRVLAYLKQYAADENGKVHLDFIVGTHSHSDHIGGFDTILQDPDITVDKAFLKVYDSSHIEQKEIDEWDNQEVYDQMVNALNARNVPIISDIPDEPFTFGDFTVTFFNTKDDFSDGKKVGENDQSIGTLIEKDGARAFLAADPDNISGDEKRLGPQIGDVDLLKVGHHSNLLSTSIGWLKNLEPEVCVVTNSFETANQITFANITRVADATILLTGDENGIIAELTDDGQILYYNDTLEIQE